MKGKTCPNCGQVKFHNNFTGIHRCTSCNAVGWLKTVGSPGAGKGTYCEVCGKQRVRKIGKKRSVTINHCYGCGATFLT